jgi:effector-binding domain-containing protein
MKALKIVIIILVVLIAIILIPPLFMPSELYIEESKVMTAQPEVIWDEVNCLENWEAWDVWHQDTNLVGYYEGPPCGKDAKNIWEMKNREGEGGSQTIIETREYEYIKTFLDFREMGSADAEFMMEPVEGGTKVTWNFRSDASYPIGRLINALFFKNMISKAYSDGLNNLEELTKEMKLEAGYKTGNISTKEVESIYAMTIRTKCKMEDMGDEMGNALSKIMNFINATGLKMAGPPFAIWYEWEGDMMEFDNAIPISKKIKGTNEIVPIKTYGGKVAYVMHTGDYESTQHSWMALENFVKGNNLETNGDPYEVYIKGPETEPDSTKWLTELYWPVK